MRRLGLMTVLAAGFAGCGGDDGPTLRERATSLKTQVKTATAEARKFCESRGGFADVPKRDGLTVKVRCANGDEKRFAFGGK
jgi:hypothetical protein